MSENKLPNRKHIRLKGFDYSTACNYFITIVTQDRLCLFGHVEDGAMVLNGAGQSVSQTIEEMQERFESVVIPNYVVMPNHIHFIVHLPGNVPLSIFISTFKSLTTHLYIEGVKTSKWRKFNAKLWQRNYYEHIIRNPRAYDYIVNYIMLNPQRWNKDAINPNHDIDEDNIMQKILEID